MRSNKTASEKFSLTAEITFDFNVLISKHAQSRQIGLGRSVLKYYDLTPIETTDIMSIIDRSKTSIVKYILDGEIENQSNFVITDTNKKISLAITASMRSLIRWKLTIKTVFRFNDKVILKKHNKELEIVL